MRPLLSTRVLRGDSASAPCGPGTACRGASDAGVHRSGGAPRRVSTGGRCKRAVQGPWGMQAGTGGGQQTSSYPTAKHTLP